MVGIYVGIREVKGLQKSFKGNKFVWLIKNAIDKLVQQEKLGKNGKIRKVIPLMTLSLNPDALDNGINFYFRFLDK